MNERCPVCVKGKITLSGSHKYCDNCDYSVFVVTQGYLDSCVILLSDLTSNTKFPSKSAFAETVFYHIEHHLPMLNRYLETIMGGRQAFGATMLLAVETQAINLQIGEELLNAEDAVRQLRCQCGADDFHVQSPSRLVCKTCNALYIYEEAEGIYKPDFLCKCGFAAYNTDDDDSPLVQCKQCNKVYMSTVTGFQPLSS